MGEEQKQILQMVAEGKVTAEEGARLLEALEKGMSRRKSAGSPAKAARARRIMKEKFGSGDIGGMEGLRDIGKMVRGIISGVVPGMDDMELEDEFMVAGVTLQGSLVSPMELQPGTRLIITRLRSMNEAGDLFLSGSRGTGLEVVGDERTDVRIGEKGKNLYLRWTSGDLRLSVPSTVVSVTASLLGGSMAVDDLPAVLKLRTKGGDIGLYGVSEEFSARTMGGNIMIRLGEEWRGDSRASTMGGNISLEVHEDSRARIMARTMGGDILVPEGMDAAGDSGRPGSSELSIDLSRGEGSSDLNVSTMGGDISLGIIGEQGSGSGAAEETRGKKK